MTNKMRSRLFLNQLDVHVLGLPTPTRSLPPRDLIYLLLRMLAPRFGQEPTGSQVEPGHDDEEHHDGEVVPVDQVNQLGDQHHRDGPSSPRESDGQADYLHGVEFGDVDEEHLEHEGDEEPHDEDDQQFEDDPRVPAVLSADLLGVQEGQAEGGQHCDGRPCDVEVSASESSDGVVADEVGDQFRGVDDQSIEVEVEPELVDQHHGGVVQDVDAHEQQHHQQRRLPQGIEPEQVEEGQRRPGRLPHRLLILHLHRRDACLAQNLTLLEPCQSAVHLGDEPEASPDLLDRVPFDEELGGLLHEEVGEDEAAGQGNEQQDDEDGAPGLEGIEGSHGHDAREAEEGLDHGGLDLPLGVGQDLAQEDDRQVVAALDAGSNQEQSKPGHSQAARKLDDQVPQHSRHQTQ